MTEPLRTKPRPSISPISAAASTRGGSTSATEERVKHVSEFRFYHETNVQFQQFQRRMELTRVVSIDLEVLVSEALCP